jgi:hypothetical protein
MPAPPPVLSDSTSQLRAEVVALLRGRNAHVDLPTALDGLTVEHINERVPGFPHSLWELTEHLRIAQADILEFATEADYTEKAWPGAYWPDEPASATAWAESKAALLADLESAVGLAETGNLLAELEHAPGYTLLRELHLVADHQAYHVGQIILLRQLLGRWHP